MAKPLEQRIGGPNSTDNLRKDPVFARDGSHASVNEIEMPDGSTVEVRPKVVTDYEEGTFTIFRPLRKR